jgi:SAM-dependent methyltransferase
LAEEKSYVPTVGQEGKDVVWVPTPYVLVEKMLDVAKVTEQDYVMDLGSGDGRNIIAAAKRGARSLGVEYNPDMVELSRRNAAKEGVGDKAIFMQGDMYEADISKATVMALFLLSENLNKLTPKFMALRPGSRIVVNGFRIEGWEPDETHRAEGDCGHWCTAYLWIVPANATGTWRLADGELTLSQNFQKLTGTWQSKGASTPIADGRLRGDQITFTAGGTQYSGRVNGDAMQGEAKGSVNGAWSASKK